MNVIWSILVYFSTFNCAKFIYVAYWYSSLGLNWSFFQLLCFVVVVVVVCHCSIPLHSWNYIEFASKIEKEMSCTCGLKLRLHVDRVGLLIRTNCIMNAVFAAIEDRNHFIASHFLYITQEDKFLSLMLKNSRHKIIVPLYLCCNITRSQSSWNLRRICSCSGN